MVELCVKTVFSYSHGKSHLSLALRVFQNISHLSLNKLASVLCWSVLFFGDLVETIQRYVYFLYCTIMCLYVPCCDGCPLQFLHENDVRFRLYLQLFVEGIMSFLRYLCLFAYSGCQHIFMSLKRSLGDILCLLRFFFLLFFFFLSFFLSFSFFLSTHFSATTERKSMKLHRNVKHYE